MNIFKLEFNEILIVFGVCLFVFTFGMYVGVHISSKNVEELAGDNIKKQKIILEQKEKIRQLQELKQFSEVYGRGKNQV